jgi:hypothetical protein
MKQVIFVFGSNLAGRHGKGAAEYAKKHCGAIPGQGEGLQGQSYAIPTKDGRNGKYLGAPSQTLSLARIRTHVNTFIDFAINNPQMLFHVTPIGCGLAGYKHAQIAPLFLNAPENCLLPPEFTAILNQQ